MDNPYTLDVLIQSAKRRADYNFQLAQETERGRDEQIRFYTQAAEMMVDICKAFATNDPEWLEAYKDW